jgi:hypothetical protein
LKRLQLQPLMNFLLRSKNLLLQLYLSF